MNVNEGYTSAWASHAAPMGGMRDSGSGRRHGREGSADLDRAADRRGAAPGAGGYLPGVSAERYAGVLTAYAGGAPTAAGEALR